MIGDYPSNSSSYSEHLLPRALNAGPNYPCTLNLIAVMGIHIYYSWLLSDFETFFYHNDSNGFVFVFSPDLFSYWLRSENGMAEANLIRVSHHVFVVIAILFAPQFARVASQFIIACVWSKWEQIPTLLFNGVLRRDLANFEDVLKTHTRRRYFMHLFHSGGVSCLKVKHRCR